MRYSVAVTTPTTTPTWAIVPERERMNTLAKSQFIRDRRTRANVPELSEGVLKTADSRSWTCSLAWRLELTNRWLLKRPAISIGIKEVGVNRPPRLLCRLADLDPALDQ